MGLTAEQLAEIQEQKGVQYQTKRAVSPELEEMLYEPVPVLDHGFVRVIDYMGNDASIVQAARVSYGTGTKKVSNDKGLIRYLMRHSHTTPFEMCEIKFHIKLPIFVARQWIRHRTANVNEYSARYSILDKEFYVPDRDYLDTQTAEAKLEKREQKEKTSDLFGLIDKVDNVTELAPQSTQNKQGREGDIEQNEAAETLKTINRLAQSSYKTYEKLLNETSDGNVINIEKKGLARELARMVLPANIYTQWYWKIDLHNLLHFLWLRADQHAQYEIRVYADAMLDLVKKWVPQTYQAFVDYKMEGFNLSSGSMKAIKKMLNGETTSAEECGLSKREWNELKDMLTSKD